MSGEAWHQPPQYDTSDGWSTIYHFTVAGILTVMTAGHFMYPATDPGSAAERPEFLVYLPWVTIAIGIAWTMFSPTNRGLRWILLGVFFGSSAAYWAFGPWWGMGVSTGGSYLIQGLRFLTEPPKPAIKR